MFAAKKKNGEDKIVRLLECAPFRSTTWRLVDGLPESLRIRYWHEVYPRWDRQDSVELNELIDRLLEAKRPKAAFFAVRMNWDEVESSRLARLLAEVATNTSETATHLKLSSHDIADAFESLQGRPEVTIDERSRLEFMYITALDHTKYGIPNLEKQVSKSPRLFMQALALTYRRKDGGDDPPEWRSAGKEAAAGVAVATHTLLTRVRRIPGTLDDGTIDAEELVAWLRELRELCRQHAREAAGDHAIGELLAKSPIGEDGIWPCEPVRDAIEEIATKDLSDGMATGVYNSRGAVWRGEGGDDERKLAAKYRSWSEAVAFEHPYVSRTLEQIARMYDHDAEWHDSDSLVRRRLRS